MLSLLNNQMHIDTWKKVAVGYFIYFPVGMDVGSAGPCVFKLNDTLQLDFLEKEMFMDH